jgi:hypothetical protein
MYYLFFSRSDTAMIRYLIYLLSIRPVYIAEIGVLLLRPSNITVFMSFASWSDLEYAGTRTKRFPLR